jgi:hypothetical protein
VNSGPSWRLAACALALALAVAAGGLGLAQTPPTEPPAASGAPALVPPPTVLLPPDEAASDAAASDAPPPKPVEPAKPVRRTAAIIQALDKVTAETLRFEAPVNQPVRYKDLVFIVHVCEDGAQGQRGAAAPIEIDSQPKAAPGRAAAPSRQVFKGWMFANAPGLHPFEHPVYDAWLIACRASPTPG